MWWLWFAALLGATGVIGLQMLREGPTPSVLGWICFLAGAAAIVYQPRNGVYLTLGLALVGDRLLLPWFPFTKNFSSFESLLYLNDRVIVSPLETFIALTFLVWLGGGLMQRKLQFHSGQLFWPAMAFAGFIAYGLGYGIFRRGDLVIGLWEARAIFYLPAMMVLASNLIQTRQHVSAVLWVAMIAIFIDGVNASYYAIAVLGLDFSSVDSIAEHAASVQANTLFVLAIAVWLFRGSMSKRLLLPPMALMIFIGYMANQRRAAYITLTLAIVVIGIVLYQRRRRLFWMIAPVVCVVGIAYLGAFWNNNGALGLPANAIKSVIGSDASASDQSSNDYRVIENINTMFTIKQDPLRGVGFGKKFYIIVPMPDISFFTWWEYITHNSIMWIWMKAGIGAFFAMLMFFGMALITGVRQIMRITEPDLSIAALLAVTYLVMHATYAYVDMSWDTQSMVFLGAMLGLINCLERVASVPQPLPAKRWPWQGAGAEPRYPQWQA